MIFGTNRWAISSGTAIPDQSLTGEERTLSSPKDQINILTLGSVLNKLIRIDKHL